MVVEGFKEYWSGIWRREYWLDGFNFSSCIWWWPPCHWVSFFFFFFFFLLEFYKLMDELTNLVNLGCCCYSWVGFFNRNWFFMLLSAESFPRPWCLERYVTAANCIVSRLFELGFSFLFFSFFLMKMKMTRERALSTSFALSHLMGGFWSCGSCFYLNFYLTFVILDMDFTLCLFGSYAKATKWEFSLAQGFSISLFFSHFKLGALIHHPNCPPPSSPFPFPYIYIYIFFFFFFWYPLPRLKILSIAPLFSHQAHIFLHFPSLSFLHLLYILKR